MPLPHSWQQSYDPAGNIWISALVASIPIVFFFVGLAGLRLKGHVNGAFTVLLALGVAVAFYHMPASMALASAGYGFLIGLFPIAWIIIAAVFLFKVAVKSGQFDVIRGSVVSLTEDQRLQMLLVGFSFGAFLEGAAGFGAPVAITASLLVGLGFDPLYAAGLCLITNTAPVAFGSMGIPIAVASQVTGIDAFKIGQVAGRQLPLVSLLIPFWIVAVMDGKRGLRETWPAVLVVGVTFAAFQYLTSNLLGPELPDLCSSLASMLALAFFLKKWKPRRIFRFSGQEAAAPKEHYTPAQVIRAWTPFVVLTAVVGVWSLKPFKALFTPSGALGWTVLNMPFPHLDKLVVRIPPIVKEAGPYPAIYSLNWLPAAGTAILVAALINIAFVRMKPAEAIRLFGLTLLELSKPVFALGTILAFANVVNYSGISATLALLLAGTGAAFPFFSPLIGWLGVLLTGSDTSSNALFCNLQSNTARQVGVSSTLLVAANTTGGVTGKMISPQSISVGSAAVGLVGRESELLRFTFWHSVSLALLVGLLTLAQAYALKGMLPSG